MPDKKKLHFWRLSLIFGTITILALMVAYGYAGPRKEDHMGTSMGSMMKESHLRNASISDLIVQQEQMEKVTGNDSMASHHAGSGSFLGITHTLTTGTVVILLPFIIAGTVFLAIVWFR